MAKKPAWDGAKNENLVELCKLILGEVGLGASAEEAEAWIKANRPGFPYKRRSLASTLSSLRRQLGGDGPTSRPGWPPASDLVRVAQATQEHGSVARLRERVKEVVDLANVVGGVERLMKCLDHLERLR